ncbi:DUF6132 family protein [Limisphaera sp. 4302-co]|mgnify:CR=1 FL=1|uniref:DUF6132 family protein n=1 Tax=Limisphaera sp. 4302-co TaxID=3400417 RepID=UPI003C289A6C
MILRLALGVVIGGVIGYGWYRLVGCSTGTCPLTSHPVISTVYGAVLGAVVASSLQ